MGSSKDKDLDSGRRNLIKGVSAGLAGAAIASTLGSLGMGGRRIGEAAAAQTPDATGSATMPAGTNEGSRAESPFFRDPPPWPEGTEGDKYSHLFSTALRENTITDVIAGPQAYFRGHSDLPGAKVNMGWQVFTKPYRLELESHYHDVDEYLFFLGAELPDLAGSFDAEIEFFLGEEKERHIITEATVLYLPAGLEHNPCDIRRISKPMMFSALQLAPYFNGVYETMGYMELKAMPKIK